MAFLVVLLLLAPGFWFVNLGIGGHTVSALIGVIVGALIAIGAALSG